MIEHGSIDPEVAVPRKSLHPLRSAEDGERHACAIAAAGGEAPIELGEHWAEGVGAHSAVDRHPTVSVVDGPVHCVGGRPAEDDGRPGLLHGLGMAPDGVEADHLAMKLGGLLRPDLADGEDLLSQLLEPRLEIRPVVLHLFDVPPAADSEEEAPSGEPIHRCGLLGSHDRIALDEQADAGRELDRFGHRGRGA